jgi:hypothetical protein
MEAAEDSFGVGLEIDHVTRTDRPEVCAHARVQIRPDLERGPAAFL